MVREGRDMGCYRGEGKAMQFCMEKGEVKFIKDVKRVLNFLFTAGIRALPTKKLSWREGKGSIDTPLNFEPTFY